MRIAWDWLVGFRPPIDRITSPPLRGRVESAGAFTTRIPSFVPKYSPRSGFRLTSSRSPQGSPNDHSKSIPGMCGIATMGPGISIRMAPSRSSATRVACFVSDPRRYSIRTVSPGSSLWARVTSLRPGPDSSSSSALMPPSDVPANLVMMSPTLKLAVDGGDAIFQHRRERRRRTAHHPGVGVDALELLLERRRFLLDRSEICGIRLPGAERPEHEQPGDRRRRGHAPCPPAAAPPAPLHQHRIAHDRPAVARGASCRQRLELRDALIQRIELRLALRAPLGVRARPAGSLARPQGQQIIHRAMHHHAAPSSSSMPRRRACARASCDLEKLTVLPICSAISSCVYPSTSCSHTTARSEEHTSELQSPMYL